MADGNVTAIELQGIIRNQTKIGMKDGMCEDLINLRFRNGSWRPAGKGRFVFSMGHTKGGKPSVSLSYSNLFIHTNVYRHILGVREGALWWFADISADGDFSAKDKRFKICDVESGDMLSVTQTGNLITIISDKGHVTYSFFNQKKNEYVSETIDENGSPDSRTLYPYGNVHFNLDCSDSEERKIKKENERGELYLDEDGGFYKRASSDIYSNNVRWHTYMMSAFAEAQEKNLFTRPFLAMVAVKLYDGTYAFASQPVLLWPREKLSSGDYYAYYTNSDQDLNYFLRNYIFYRDKNTKVAYSPCGKGFLYHLFTTGIKSTGYIGSTTIVKRGSRDEQVYVNTIQPVYVSGTFSTKTGVKRLEKTYGEPVEFYVRGADLLLSIDNLDIIKRNPQIFTGIGIFITPEIDYYSSKEKGELLYHSNGFNELLISHSPVWREKKEVIHDLMHSPFFLLRDYTEKELSALHETLKVDLSDPKYDGVLKSISEGIGVRFTAEAVDRKSYHPKVAYNYNGRLHLANYKSDAFYGYPIDSFLYNNHNGIVDKSSKDFCLHNFKEIEDVKNIVGYIKERLTNTYQFDRPFYKFVSKDATDALKQYVHLIDSFLSIDVYIATEQGEQVVSRYIKPYFDDGSETFNYGIEHLPPILSFPDIRATKMVITFSQFQMNTGTDEPYLYQYRSTFPLQPHPYLNIAYYMDPDMHPIKITSDIDSEKDGVKHEFQRVDDIQDGTQWTHAALTNATEFFPNGVKVSSTENPLAFPYQNTYLVGSSEIVAMCSNAVAVGTGQTGAAPLYVFSKDGVYALFVGADGTMAYTNARVIARDVCNNKRSVVPIDSGVTFTTDRGLMVISGEEVQEVGAVAEGEPLQYIDTTAATGRFTPRTVGRNILTNVSELPATICDGKDFLAYIKGASIAYNHNLRELIVSNPSYGYSYVMDREGKWKRYTMTADEYVNNYPTLYRVEQGEWYKIDEEEPKQGDTSGVVNDDADNRILLLSQAVKLDSIGFKNAHRMVVRGYFETQTKYEDEEIEVPAVVKQPVEIHLYPNPHYHEYENNIVHIETAKETNIDNMLISDMETFTVQEGDVCDITIRYSTRDMIVIMLSAEPVSENIHNSGSVSNSGQAPIQTEQSDLNSDTSVVQEYYYAFSKEHRNYAFVRYVLRNDDTHEIVWSRIFNAGIYENEMHIDLQAEDETIHLENPGNYSLYLEMSVHDVIDTEPYIYHENFTLKGIVTSILTGDTISVENLALATNTLYMPEASRENAYANVLYTGYMDIVCDPEHTANENKVCKFASDPSAELGYSIESGDGTVLVSRVFRSEKLDDYTMRVYLCDKEVDEDDNTILTPIQEEVTELASTADGNPYGTNNFVLRLNSLAAQLEDTVGAVNPFGTSEHTIPFVCNTSIASNKSNAAFSQPVHIELTAATDSSKFLLSIQGSLAISLAIKDGVDAAVALENTIVAADQHLDFVLKDKTTDTVINTFSPSLSTEKQVSEQNYLSFRIAFNFSGFAETQITEGHVYEVYMADTYALSIEVINNYQLEDLFVAQTNYGFSGAIQPNDYQPQYKLGFVFPAIEYDEDNNVTEDNTARVIHTVEWHRKLSLSTEIYNRIENESGIEGIWNEIACITPAYIQKTSGLAKVSYLGVYVFGSYDGRQWALLGWNNKSGKFTDIGCKVERTDVRFLRFALVGNLKGTSRIEYIEISSKPSVLSTKIR